jgi:hypothetical protein
MYSIKPKTVEKKNPNEVKDCINSRRNKEASGFNPYKKPRFTGGYVDLKECIFDCKGDKQGGTFEMNLKKLSIYAGSKYNTGSDIMTMIDRLTPVNIKKQTTYLGNDPIELKIYDLQIAQFVKMQGRFDSEYKKQYPVIIGQCTEYMMAKLNGIPSFKTIHT